VRDRDTLRHASGAGREDHVGGIGGTRLELDGLVGGLFIDIQPRDAHVVRLRLFRPVVIGDAEARTALPDDVRQARRRCRRGCRDCAASSLQDAEKSDDNLNRSLADQDRRVSMIQAGSLEARCKPVGEFIDVSIAQMSVTDADSLEVRHR
jgi:hypothetical protein